MHVNLTHMASEIVHISGVDTKRCMKCGKCSGACPAFETMDIHPHQVVSLVEAGDIETLLCSKSLFNCLSCFACVERCPRKVEPARLFEAARLMRIRRQGENHIKPENIPGLLDEDIPQQLIASAFRKYAK